MILGLDISTNMIGISVIDKDDNLLHCDHVDLRKIDSSDYNLMGDKFAEHLKFIDSEIKIEHVFVEEAGKKFRRGTSSADTIFKLARINGIVCYICWQEFNILPVELEVKKARRDVGLIIPKYPRKLKYSKKRKIIKEAVINFVLDRDTAENFGFEKTRYDNWQVWCEDRADAYVIALAGNRSIVSS